MIRERNIAQIILSLAPVKRAPSAVAILHAQQPLYASAAAPLPCAFRPETSRAATPSAQTQCRSTSEIEIVAVFKRPAARLGILVLICPVAAAKNVSSAANPSPSPVPDDPPAIPPLPTATIAMHVSHTGETHGCRRIVSPSSISISCKFLDFAERQRIVRPVPHRHQRENRIHHRGINRRQPSVRSMCSQHPLLRFPQRLIRSGFHGSFS